MSVIEQTSDLEREYQAMVEQTAVEYVRSAFATIPEVGQAIEEARARTESGMRPSKYTVGAYESASSLGELGQVLGFLLGEGGLQAIALVGRERFDSLITGGRGESFFSGVMEASPKDATHLLDVKGAGQRFFESIIEPTPSTSVAVAQAQA